MRHRPAHVSVADIDPEAGLLLADHGQAFRRHRSEPGPWRFLPALATADLSTADLPTVDLPTVDLATADLATADLPTAKLP
jgi:uncharacterized protein YjbI with pentapeptide repeats